MSAPSPPRGSLAAVAGELAFLWYAVAWTARPEIPAGATAFTHHRAAAPILWIVIALSVVEIGLVHLLVASLNPTVGALVLVLSVLSLVWLLGLANALAKRPLLVSDAGVRLRLGLLLDLWMPRDAIASVHAVTDAGDLRRPGFLKAALIAYPDTVIELARPLAVRRRPIATIALRPDDGPAFRAAVEALLTASP